MQACFTQFQKGDSWYTVNQEKNGEYEITRQGKEDYERFFLPATEGREWEKRMKQDVPPHKII